MKTACIEKDGLEVICFYSGNHLANMYVCLLNGELIVIDPFYCSEVITYIKDSGYHKIQVLLTHEHYDHISGVEKLRRQFHISVICSENCGKHIQNPEENLSAFISENLDGYHCRCKADLVFSSQICLEAAGRSIILTETPGHSPGSICIFISPDFLFVGDSLSEDGYAILKLPGHDKKQYQTKTLPFLNSFHKDVIVLPGHGSIKTIGAYFL